MDSLESRANRPKTIADPDEDVYSIMADDSSGLNISEHLATEASSETSTTPVGAPVEPIQVLVVPTKAPTESNMTSDEVGNSANCNNDHGLCDPLANRVSLLLQISGY